MSEHHFKNVDFYYALTSCIDEGILKISGTDFVHITKVIRKQVGDEVFVVDGLGSIYHCSISNISKNYLLANIISKSESTNENGIAITLALGLLKNPSKFDFVVEKAVELGVKKIIPFTSKFTISQKPKVERWQNLAISAMKQSQRAFLPLISDMVSFKELLDYKADIKLIADIEAESTIVEKENIKEIIIIIGTEGGFSEEEIISAEEAGYKKINLSKNRLRAETAAIVSLPIILERFFK
jgi:16S rRNA (uracil1498-N3)-methyltransferase